MLTKLVLSPVIQMAKAVAWLRFKYGDSFVRTELGFYGAYGPMAGIYAYKKQGAWKFGYRGAPEEKARPSLDTPSIKEKPSFSCNWRLHEK